VQANFTLEAWFNFSALPGAFNTIFEKENGA